MVISQHFVTTGAIAEELRVSVKRVRSIIDNDPEIRHVDRIGITRLFDRSVIERIRAEIARIDARMIDRRSSTAA